MNRWKLRGLAAFAVIALAVAGCDQQPTDLPTELPTPDTDATMPAETDGTMPTDNGMTDEASPAETPEADATVSPEPTGS
jgi:hypothetical protein